MSFGLNLIAFYLHCQVTWKHLSLQTFKHIILELVSAKRWINQRFKRLKKVKFILKTQKISHRNLLNPWLVWTVQWGTRRFWRQVKNRWKCLKFSDKIRNDRQLSICTVVALNHYTILYHWVVTTNFFVNCHTQVWDIRRLCYNISNKSDKTKGILYWNNFNLLLLFYLKKKIKMLLINVY